MKSIKKIVHVEGMNCAACSSAVERNISKLEGVIKASVNLATEKLTVEYDAEKISMEEISDKVDKLGYKVVIKSDLKDITIPVDGMT